MLDGADEIAPKYEKKFFDILKLILWSTAVKIFENTAATAEASAIYQGKSNGLSDKILEKTLKSC